MTKPSKKKTSRNYQHDSLFGAGAFIPVALTLENSSNVETLEASIGGSRMLIRCIEVKDLYAPFVALNTEEQKLIDLSLQIAELCDEMPSAMRAITNYDHKTKTRTFYYPVTTLAQN